MLERPSPGSTLLWLTNAGALPDAGLEAYRTWLSEGERQRCGRFVRAERCRQFIVGRAMLRLALGRLLSVAPRSIALRERPGNAPALDMPAPPCIGFSISHSGPWVACAATTEGALGLDIERIDPRRDVLALAGQALGSDAVARLRVCEGEERVHAFYRMWCMHEAGIKLGIPGKADYLFEYPGLTLALRCARPLPAMPVLHMVALKDTEAPGAKASSA